MLPHEAEVTTEIAKKYRVQLDAMTALHDAVVSMMTAGCWTVSKTRGLAPFVAETMMGLLTGAPLSVAVMTMSGRPAIIG
jgi:hypothetical protein